MTHCRLTADDWEALCWQAGLSEGETDVFRRRELEGQPVAAIARARRTTSHAVRQLLAGAWRRLQEHAWTEAEVRRLRDRLRQASVEEEWVEVLIAAFRLLRWNPPTPEYDHLGRQIAQHQPLLNRDDYRTICARR